MVCSAERPLVEEQRRPEKLFGVLAGWQYNNNSQTVAERQKAQLWTTDAESVVQHRTITNPWLRVYVKSVVFQSPWKPKSGRKEAGRAKTLTYFSRTKTTGKPYIHQNEQFDFSQMVESSFIYVWLQISKFTTERNIKSQSYKNGIINVQDQFINGSTLLLQWHVGGLTAFTTQCTF